jgi:hypothetical protein
LRHSKINTAYAVDDKNAFKKQQRKKSEGKETKYCLATVTAEGF